MANNNFDPKDGSKSSLSDMINEYENDNALRNKIEAAKKQKAMEEEARRQAEIQQRLAEIEREKMAAEAKKEPVRPVQPHETTELPPMAATKPFLNADIDATQVFTTESIKLDDDGDKTLVIMDNMKQRNFSETASQKMTEPPKTDMHTDRLAPEFEVNNEKITEEDIEEYLPKDNKKKKKPMDPNKMNKTITYVIAGIAGICVIGLIVFALNFFDVFGGGDDGKSLKLDEVTVDEKVNMEEIGANNFTMKSSEVTNVTDATLIKLAKAEAKSTEDGTKVQITDVDKTALKDTKGTYSVSFATKKGTKVTVKATVTEDSKKNEDDGKDKEEQPEKDNSAKINELEGQIKVNNDLIATLQGEINSFQNVIDNAPEELAKIDNGYVEQLTSANRAVTDATAKVTAANQELETATAANDKAKIEAANKKLESANTELNTANAALNTLKTEIETKKSNINSSVSEAQSEVSTRTQRILELQNEIISLQDQLNQLK